MNTRKSLQQILVLTLIVVLLAGCGRAPADPGVASTPTPPTVTPAEAIATQPIEDASQEETHQPTPPMVTTTEVQVTEQPVQDPSPEETDQVDDDASALRTALAAHFGVSPDGMAFVIAEQTEEHATGGLPGGYFLAAREEGTWVIVYDGQATPSCEQIAPYDFPLDMVPECLDGENNLVVRTANQ
jgi:hypothetical protein